MEMDIGIYKTIMSRIKLSSLYKTGKRGKGRNKEKEEGGGGEEEKKRGGKKEEKKSLIFFFLGKKV